MLGQQGEYTAAYTYLHQSLAIYQEMGDKVRSSGTLTRLGYLAIAQGDYPEAEKLLSEALVLIRGTGHLRHQIDTLDALGRLAQLQGEYARAITLHKESLALCIELEYPSQLARILEAFAYLAVRQGQAEAAVRLFGATARHLIPSYVPVGPTWYLVHDQEYEHLVALARTQLGEATFTALWAAGATMTLDEALSFVRTQHWS
jgi:tetratricopeptide (TPR) repeat protein